MRKLETDIAIAASPEQVWDVLIDFDAYPEWNPFITSIAGLAQPGERLAVALTLAGGRTINMRPRVQDVEPARRFAWLGHLGVRGVFDGAHELVAATGRERHRVVHPTRDVPRGARAVHGSTAHADRGRLPGDELGAEGPRRGSRRARVAD